MTATITLDAEFAARCRKLTPEEENKLEENLLRDGCLFPLVLWAGHGILLDGHNRKRLCDRNGIDYATTEVECADRAAAIKWIDDNVLGQRNLKEAELDYHRGKKYLAEKKGRGGDGSNQHAQKGHDVPIASTAAKIAATEGVSDKTVKRDAQYAAAIDKITAVAPQAAAAILSEKVKVSKKKVVEMATLPPAEMKAAAEAATQPKEEAASLIATIEALMKDGKPRTLTEIQKHCGRSDAATISARLRDLKRKYNVTNDKDSKRYTLSPLTAEDRKESTFPQRLKWASKRRSITIDDLAEEFGIAASKCKAEIVAANQSTGYIVKDVGDGDYLVRKAAHFEAEKIANLADAMQRLHDMAEEASRTLLSTSSVQWTHADQHKFVCEVSRIAKAFSG